MSIRGWSMRLRALARRAAVEVELDEELRYHVERETELLVSRGVEPTEARRRALAALGGMESTKEAYREGRGDRWLRELGGDARYALRTLRRSPSLTGAALVTLALGIGASVAIFSVVNAVILRPLPFPAPDELVMLWEDNPDKGWRRNVVAPANLLDWRERVRAFRDVGGYVDGTSRVVLAGRGEQQVLSAQHVTGSLLSVLGVAPLLGRTFTAEESWRGDTRPVVVSYRAWQDRLGGRADVVGAFIDLDGRPHQVVGVMPEGFDFPRAGTEAWIPMGWDPAARERVSFRRAHYLRAVARLRPGVSREQGDAALQGVVRQLQQEYPATNTNMGAGLGDLHDFLVGDRRVPLLVLLAATALLLLIACANVGNLMLVRAAGREREVVLRRALGAGRWRVARQALTESLVLSAAGGTAGLLLGWWGTRLLLALQPEGLLPVATVTPDAGVFLFALAVTAASGALFGLAPALWSGRRSPADVLKEDSRGASDGRRARTWERSLVVSEVAVAVLLTIGAGLLVRSYSRLARLDPGFDAGNVLTLSVSLPGARYDTTEKILDFYGELVRRVGRVPGVTSAALVSGLPLTQDFWTSDFSVAGRPAEEYGREVAHRSVTPEYFRTLRVPLIAGRFFTEADSRTGEPVIVINQALAEKYFRGKDPLGEMIAFQKLPDSASVWRRVVGVVGSERQRSLSLDPQIEILAPVEQDERSSMSLVVRTEGDPLALTGQVRAALASLDPAIPPLDIRTLEDVRAGSLARDRFLAALLLTFAVVGLLLAVVGVYGVMAQLALRRTREMGIRIALGAPSARVRWLIVRHGFALTAGGVVIGVGVALFATRVMQSLLFEVTPRDVATFAGVPLLMIVSGLLATWLPARRATRADQAQALRAA